MITKLELNPSRHHIEDELSFERLYIAMNAIRIAYGKPMIVSSGIRSNQDIERIYAALGRPPNYKTLHHVSRCKAVDIRDRDGKLWDWLDANKTFVRALGLYLEDKAYTPHHVHFQTVPPGSGKWIFRPW